MAMLNLLVVLAGALGVRMWEFDKARDPNMCSRDMKTHERLQNGRSAI